MVKYFSGFSLPIHWINTPSSLPPSNAGIGRTLNIANANDIMPAKARYNFRPPACSNASPNLMAPAGQVSLLREPFILSLLSESRSLPKLPKAENVSTNCAFTSLTPTRIAVKNGNLIGLRLSSPAWKVSQRMQLSAGQCDCATTFFLSLVKSTVMS